MKMCQGARAVTRRGSSHAATQRDSNRLAPTDGLTGATCTFREDPGRDTAPIPVEGDNILQQITGTELEVLKMIVDLGEGTVPEIKGVIGKTREHTARLLKKLYEKGYIDRNTSSMPYRYSIRKEIRELIMGQSEEPTLNF